MARRTRPGLIKISLRKLVAILLLFTVYLVYCFVAYVVYLSNANKPVAVHVNNFANGIAKLQPEVKHSDSAEKEAAQADVIKKNIDFSYSSNRALFMPTNSINKNVPSIDLVNDYYPAFDFKFVFPEISPKVDGTQNIFLIVLVTSGAKGKHFRNNRHAIRETWGNEGNCEQREVSKDERLKGLRWMLVFVVGKAGLGTNDDELNIAEARQHNDMLIGNITDKYSNLIVKLYIGLVWASRFDIQYIMKTDDDVYVRIPRVMEYLVNAKFPRPFYGGLPLHSSKVHREIGHKWTISYKYYGEKYYPTYSRGAFLILSSDLLNKLFNHVYKRKPFHVEDAYVGLALHDLGVKITKIVSFSLKVNSKAFFRNSTDCTILNLVAFGHRFTPEFSRYLHTRMMRLVCGRTNLKC